MYYVPSGHLGLGIDATFQCLILSFAVYKFEVVNITEWTPEDGVILTRFISQDPSLLNYKEKYYPVIWFPLFILVSIVLVCCTEYHRLVDWNNRNLFFTLRESGIQN